MPTVTTPPWVNYFNEPTTGVDSTPTLILGRQLPCIIRAMLLTNTTNQEIFIFVYFLQERLVNSIETPIQTFFKYNFSLKPYESVDLIEGKAPFLQAGDTVWAYTDLSGNRFDCNVMGDELTELGS
jgi:hypothetical protein